MQDYRKFYINGEWVAPIEHNDFPVENPATERQIAIVSHGSVADINAAVIAARQAFPSFSQSSKKTRLALLVKLLAIYLYRYDEMAQAIHLEMGAPIDFAHRAQADCGRGHLQSTINALQNYTFEQTMNNSLITKEAIGVCGFITPWNWPINQIVCKVAPAVATGCTMILKPSELSPLSAHVFAEMIDEAGFPAGVFNLVNGCGAIVGNALAEHPDIDMISFTGSTRAGISVAKAAADSVKRVAQELGGKSPNILLDDADFERSIKQGIFMCMENTGQSCDAPTRMLIPQSRYEEAIVFAQEAVKRVKVDHTNKAGRHLGPVVSRDQYNNVQRLIQAALDEGARLVAGGLGKPKGLETGYYVKPTIFANVRNDMTIAREEVFGPVLVMIPYLDEEEAISIANDTPYGLSAYIQTGDTARGKSMAHRLRAGMVRINHAPHSYDAPFGGYKQSGNGREWGKYGFEDYLEIKAISI